jgi:hypothetical protein
VPPRFLYSLVNHAEAYAEGHTSNLRLASALTLEYSALFLGVGPEVFFLGLLFAFATT